MKTILFTLLATFASSSAYASTYEFTCTPQYVSQGSGPSHDIDVAGSLDVKLTYVDSNSPVTIDYDGKLKAGYDFDGSNEMDDMYVGTFKNSKESKLSPRARKYKDSSYYRFPDFDADSTGRHDGGGMWGYLVISKGLFQNNTFDAYYVFQSGDHMGGTMSLTCSK